MPGFYCENNMQSVYFRDGQGEGYITNSKLEMKSKVIFHAEPILLGADLLEPLQHYNIGGFYNRSLQYFGILDDKTNCDGHSLFVPEGTKELIFYLGEHDGKHFWTKIYWISATRFVKCFSPKAMRDFNFKSNGKWCFQHKGKTARFSA